MIFFFSQLSNVQPCMEIMSGILLEDKQLLKIILFCVRNTGLSLSELVLSIYKLNKQC